MCWGGNIQIICNASVVEDSFMLTCPHNLCNTVALSCESRGELGRTSEILLALGEHSAQRRDLLVGLDATLTGLVVLGQARFLGLLSVMELRLVPDGNVVAFQTVVS